MSESPDEVALPAGVGLAGGSRRLTGSCCPTRRNHFPFGSVGCSEFRPLDVERTVRPTGTLQNPGDDLPHDGRMLSISRTMLALAEHAELA